MNTELSPEESARWQKHFASQANNRAWSLAEQASRTPDEDEEMLQAAHTAMHLWKTLGTPRNHAHSALLLAQAYALLDIANPAAHYLAKASQFFIAEPGEPWEQALLHAIGANAAFRLRQTEKHLDEYCRAEAMILALPDPEDRRILYATLGVIAKPAAHDH